MPHLAAAALLAVLLLCAPSAQALPGDPGIQSLGPEDGAVVPADPDGIPVRFTCPVYREFTAGLGFTDFGGADDYGVDFATSPELGSDGRLREDRRVALGGSRESNVTGEGECVSAMAAYAGIGQPGPQETPGTYFWQPWRPCGGCATGNETGPVRRFVVRTEVDLALEVQREAYAGFAVIAQARLRGVPNGGRVVVERRAGAGWARLAVVAAFRERGEAELRLPSGRQRLRLVAELGDQRSVSEVRTVRVVPARRWRTSRADDGRYAGRGEGRSVRFRVARGGRELRDFSAQVSTLCPGPTVEQNRFLVGLAPLARARIAPDGRFVATGRPGRQTTVRVRGRLRRGRVTGGRVELRIGTCVGSADFSARRA